MYKIGKLPGSIDIGFVGETAFRKIEIDMTEWMKDTPDGVPSIIHVRPGETKADAYVAVTEFDTETNVLTWTITAADIGTLDGDGDAQIWIEAENNSNEIVKRGKSVHVKTHVNDAANDPSSETPTSQAAFAEQITALKVAAVNAKDDAVTAKTDAEAAAAAAQAAVTHPAYIDSTTLCWMVWSIDTGAYVNTGISATGDPTLLLDDQHISENKTYSSNKIDTELTNVKNAIAQLPDMEDSSAIGVDMDLTDPSGNVLLRMMNGHLFTKNFNSAKYGAKIVTLKSDGTGDFSTLSAALASITDANSETNPYEIHVYPGTYNTLEGYTDEEIRSADIGGGYSDTSFVGAKLTDGISLIGIGDPAKIILTATLDSTEYSSAIRGNISTLNTQGTCAVKNVTIRAQKLRYCVHDDFGSSKHYTRIVENCIFEGLGVSMAYDPAVTWGAGIAKPGITAIFKNCDFGYSFGYHTRAGMTGNSLVIFENCRGLCCKIGDNANEADAAHHTFIFDNCDVNAVKISRTSATTPHVSVIGTGNKDMMCMAPVADNPMISGLMKTAASSVAIGTLVTVSAGEITANSNGINAVAASDIDTAIGVIVFRDSLYDYIQTDGYIPASRIGLSSLSVGDYITVDGNMKLTDGGTASNAVGVVKYTDNDDAQILLRRF